MSPNPSKTPGEFCTENRYNVMQTPGNESPEIQNLVAVVGNLLQSNENLMLRRNYKKEELKENYHSVNDSNLPPISSNRLISRQNSRFERSNNYANNNEKVIGE